MLFIISSLEAIVDEPMQRSEGLIGELYPIHIGDTVSVRVGIVYSAAVVEIHPDGSVKIQSEAALRDTAWISVGTPVIVSCPGGAGHE